MQKENIKSKQEKSDNKYKAILLIMIQLF